MIYTAFADFMADGIYKGTLALMSSFDQEQANIASDLWTDFRAATLLANFYRQEYECVNVITYVKQVS